LVNALGDKNLEIEFHVIGMDQTGQEIKCKEFALRILLSYPQVRCLNLRRIC
jgi:hypothetical protein